MVRSAWWGAVLVGALPRRVAHAHRLTLGRRDAVLAEVEQVTAVVLLLALVLGHLVRVRVRG